jgi:hypothetical protein
MKRLIKKLVVSCSAVFALASVAMMSAPAAHAGEFCTVNNSYMRSCGYDTMAQCQAMLGGRDGTCVRDPFLADNNSASLANKRTAFASLHEPHHHHHHHVKKHHHG